MQTISTEGISIDGGRAKDIECDRLLKKVAKVARDLSDKNWESSVPLVLLHLQDLQAVRQHLQNHIISGGGPDALMRQIGQIDSRLQNEAEKHCGQDTNLPQLLEQLELKLKGYIPARPAHGAKEIRRLAADILQRMQEHDAVATFLLLEAYNTDIGLGG